MNLVNGLVTVNMTRKEKLERSRDAHLSQSRTSVKILRLFPLYKSTSRTTNWASEGFNKVHADYERDLIIF